MERQKISTRKTHSSLYEKIAKTILWIAAGTAIGILVWIVGSIMVQGFVVSKNVTYPALPKGEKVVSLDAAGEETAVFIVNSNVRIDELTAADVLDFYQAEKTDWVIAGQDYGVKLFAPAADSPLTLAFKNISGEKDISLARGIQSFGTRDEVIKLVAENPGAIGFIERGGIPILPAAVKPISILDSEGKEIIFIVNRQLSVNELTKKQLFDVFSGEETDWKFLGTNLPVLPAVYTSAPAYREFMKMINDGRFNAIVTSINNDRELIKLIGSTAGALGFVGAEALSEVEKQNGVRVLSVRSLSLFANASVFEIKNNKALRFLTENQFVDIFSGNLKNWSEANGIDLDLIPVICAPQTAPGRAFRRLYPDIGEKQSPAAVKIVQSDAELIKMLKTTDGAIGFGNYFLLYNNPELKIVEIQRHEIGPNLTFSYLFEAPSKSSRAGGVSTIIGNTIFMILLTVIFAAPLGIGAAVYFVEYARQGRLVATLRFFTETLAGIPSIIYGLFGYILFRLVLGIKEGLLSAALTLCIMILPTIVRTTEEALKAVPRAYREESLALGATLWQTVRRVILPAASPGILTGIILGIGRAIGETAAVLFTCGTSSRFVLDQGINLEMFTKSARVLALHIYLLFGEGGGDPRALEHAFATSAVLVIVILIINTLANRFIRRMNKLRKL